MRYRFSGFTMDLDRYELRWRGERLDLQPKVFAVLRHLLENAERTVPKNELLDSVWPDVATGDESLMKAVSQARRQLAAHEPELEIIRTVRGRGYGIGVPVEVEDSVDSAHEPGTVESPGDPATNESPGPPGDGSEAKEIASSSPAPRTPRGAVRPPADRTADRSRSRGPLLWIAGATGGGLALLVALGLYLSMPPDDLAPVAPAAIAPSTGAPASALAVLPFVDMSPTGDHEFLGQGLSEELIDDLAQRPELRVAARTSAFAFQGSDASAQEIARQLGVGSLVEGSVRVSKGRLRVTAQLIRASDGFHLWSQTYDRPMADLLSVQEEIASAIAAELQARLLPAEAVRRKTRDPQAQLAYLRGSADLAQPTPQRVRRALESFQLAVELDPTFADAHAGVADAYFTLWNSYSREPRDGELMTLGEDAARRAMAADERSAAAHEVMATVQCGRYRRWGECRATLQRGLALNPNSVSLLNSYAAFMTKLGRFDEALAAIERATAIDPLSANAIKLKGRIHLYRADYDQAIALLHRAYELRPSDPDIPSLLSKAYGIKGMEDESREAVLLIWSEGSRPLVRIAAQVLGTVRFLRTVLWIAALETGNPCGHAAWAASHIYAYTGEAEAMLGCLEQESRRHLWYVRVEPAFDPYRSDQRFVELLERSGFGSEMVASAFE